VAQAIIATLSDNVRSLLPAGSATLAALHDIGKITIGFQAKCPQRIVPPDQPPCPIGEMALSVTDHALVSQRFLQQLPEFTTNRLWAVAVGAHHGRPKGRKIPLNQPPEALPAWADQHRHRLLNILKTEFGPLPTAQPNPQFAPFHSDLWLLAGLITVADWIGSNEVWFSPENGLPPLEARRQAGAALHEIGWPGGKVRLTEFSAAFAGPGEIFEPNSLQQAVAEAAHVPGIIIVEGPMGCGKTEAALFATQQLIVAGHQRGFYFALPTQVTSNRIHERIRRFLMATLEKPASLRLAHGNAWLEDDFNLRLNPSFRHWEAKDGEQPAETPREARSWFASPKQALLAPYGVGTVDQALQAVVAVKHFFVRRFALAGKVVILDEVHSYDIYTGTLITALIRELVNLRCSVIILSATLTAARRQELLAAAGIQETVSPPDYPLVSFSGADGKYRHLTPAWSSLKNITLRAAIIAEDETIYELCQRAEAGQHVLWIRNTVVEAQQAFRAAVSAVRQDAVRVGLLHSRFPFARRAELEQDWLDQLGRNRPDSGSGSILIATQVVEQSVDIDLDFIVSDLAPTDMLLQRLGRLWRHERTRRGAAQPNFWIRLPALDPDENSISLRTALGRTARVYAPYVLLRTAAIWKTKSLITLPTDIRPLLEATYADPGSQEPESWRALRGELEQEKIQLTENAQAATLVLGRPMLQDEDAILTRRQGPPTTPVTLLRSVNTTGNNSVRVVALDGTEAEISAYEWRRSAARFLYQWVVRTPRWLVPANAPCPSWLTLHGPNQATVAIVDDAGRCLFADQPSNLTYDSRLGVFADRFASVPDQPANDDEFDY
jgi:CRISPR-associated endonuclease/helicase Cas3